MLGSEKCPIWGTDAKIWPSDGSHGKCVNSARCGGAYEITRHAEINLGGHDDHFKARLTTWLNDQRRIGAEMPQVTAKVLEFIQVSPPLPVHERVTRLLNHFASEQPHIGASIDIAISGLADSLYGEGLSEAGSFCAAVSESLNDLEIGFLIEQLEASGFIKKTSRERCQITLDGYRKIEEDSRRETISKNAFVAMWFGEEMQHVYDGAIAPGIIAAGYEPVRIDNKQHNNKIDDEIVAEIRRARFVVADFTHGPEEGMRGGVYYEAGFARGLGLEVISTCEASLLKENKIHFDTRQFNHIGWSLDDLEGFGQALSNRISATIGDGPLRHL
jgi:nucleoside 2-deoxyribosyltransferase